MAEEPTPQGPEDEEPVEAEAEAEAEAETEVEQKEEETTKGPPQISQPSSVFNFSPSCSVWNAARLQTQVENGGKQ